MFVGLFIERKTTMIALGNEVKEHEDLLLEDNFLLDEQYDSEEEFSDETIEAMNDTLNDTKLYGPYDTVEEAFAAMLEK